MVSIADRVSAANAAPPCIYPSKAIILSINYPRLSNFAECTKATAARIGLRQARYVGKKRRQETQARNAGKKRRQETQARNAGKNELGL
jgi:hypothetical protein